MNLLYSCLCLCDLTLDLAAGLPALRLHNTLIQARMCRLCPLNHQARHVVLHLDGDALPLLDDLAVVVEGEVVLGAPGEADVESDAVSGHHDHFFQGSLRFG